MFVGKRHGKRFTQSAKLSRCERAAINGRQQFNITRADLEGCFLSSGLSKRIINATYFHLHEFQESWLHDNVDKLVANTPLDLVLQHYGLPLSQSGSASTA